MLIIALILTIFLIIAFLPLAIERISSSEDLADMGIHLKRL
jgi:hypothetical protein